MHAILLEPAILEFCYSPYHAAHTHENTHAWITHMHEYGTFEYLMNNIHALIAHTHEYIQTGCFHGSIGMPDAPAQWLVACFADGAMESSQPYF